MKIVEICSILTKWWLGLNGYRRPIIVNLNTRHYRRSVAVKTKLFRFYEPTSVALHKQARRTPARSLVPVKEDGMSLIMHLAVANSNSSILIDFALTLVWHSLQVNLLITFWSCYATEYGICLKCKFINMRLVTLAERMLLTQLTLLQMKSRSYRYTVLGIAARDLSLCRSIKHTPLMHWRN